MRFLSRLAPVVFLLTPLVFSAVGCGDDDDNPVNPPATGPTFDTGLQATDHSFSFVFNQNGAWSYRCTAHGAMTGTVTVNASGTDSVLVTVAPGGAMSFSPLNANVKTGGTVRWVWAASGHSVTRP